MGKSVYERVENLYNEKKDDFEVLETIFSNDFTIDKVIIRDSIKRMLVESFDLGNKEYLVKYKYRIRSFFTYYSVMLYFLFLSFFGKRKRNTQKFDILLENWAGNNFELFYKRIYKTFSSLYGMAILDVAKKSSKSFYPNDSIVLMRKSNHKHWYLNTISFLIFKKQFNKYFEYKRLSKNSKIDFINISLRLQRYIAVYNTDVLNLNAKFLISAADNYYNSLRYFIYTRYGINKILLIQNGYRGGEVENSSGEMYTYCDYYLGFGEQNIEIQKGMVCSNKIANGSLRLYDNILLLNKNQSIEYDIIFIEQLALIKVESFDVDRYIEIVDLLCHFAINYKNYNILYKTRPNRLQRYTTNNAMLEHINKIDTKLKKAKIIIDDGLLGNSYEALLKSNIVVYYNSTMGIEALGVDKKVLCYNPDKLSFQVAIEDEIGCLIKNSYKLFEEKLIYLLNNDTNEIKSYYKNKKNDFMQLDKDPILVIENILNKNRG